MSENEFFSQYAALAMEQQVKYGIPASITLAQMALESGYGKGRAIKEGNNAFCVKSGSSEKWNQPGNYIILSDDRANERFRKYETLQASFDDHSRVLMSSYYSHCHNLKSDDYIGWSKGLVSGKYKYATDPDYAEKLQSIIETYRLYEYDAQALAETKEIEAKMSVDNSSSWSMPVKTDRDLVVTSDYGTRVHPVTGERGSNHPAVDIGIPKGTTLLGTEQHGIVTRTNWNSTNGNCVEVAYTRGTDTYTVQYLHMSRVDVEVGQEVGAGDRIGLSGDTGRVTGAHLDFRVQKNGSPIDPKEYLAEIAVLGGIDTTLVSKDGKDLLADMKENVRADYQNRQLADQPLSDQQLANIEQYKRLSSMANSNDPTQWLSLMMSQEGGESEGLLSGLISTLFHAAIVLALRMQYGESSHEEQQYVHQLEEEKKPLPSTIVDRKREGIDYESLCEAASSSYELENVSSEQSVTMKRS